MSNTITPTAKRKTVRKHKDAIIESMSGKQKNTVRSLIIKFHRDFRSVSSKRGTRNFQLNRWLDSNL